MTYYDPAEEVLLHPLPSNDIRKFWRVAVLAKHLGIPRTTIQSACWEGFLEHQYSACGCLMTTLEWVWEWQRKRKFKDPRLTPLPTVDILTATGVIGVKRADETKRIREKRNSKNAQQRNHAQ